MIRRRRVVLIPAVERERLDERAASLKLYPRHRRQVDAAPALPPETDRAPQLGMAMGARSEQTEQVFDHAEFIG